MANSYGYVIRNIELSRRKTIYSDGEAIKIVKELIKPGFALINSRKEYREIDGYVNDEMCLWFEKNNLDLISYSKYTIRLKKCKIHTNEYWRSSIPFTKSESDYSDGSDPCFTDCINSKNIIKQKYEHIRSMFILKNEDSPIIPYSHENDGPYDCMLGMSTQEYSESVINVKNIEEVIKENIDKPLITNPLRGLEKRINSLLYIFDKANQDNFVSNHLKKSVKELFPYDWEDLLLPIINKDFTILKNKIDILSVKYAEILRTKLDEVIFYVTGIKWITKNPGRQWTSSINPIIEDPREWYGDKYKSFRIFDEKIETTLRCIYKFSDTLLKRFPKNLFRLLMIYIVKSY